MLFLKQSIKFFSAGIYFFKVNKGNTRTVCEINNKVTRTTSLMSFDLYSSREQISHIVPVFSLLTVHFESKSSLDWLPSNINGVKCCIHFCRRQQVIVFPANICLSKANNRTTKKRCEICWDLTIKKPERCQLWTNFRPFSKVSIVDFEQGNNFGLINISTNHHYPKTSYTFQIFLGCPMFPKLLLPRASGTSIMSFFFFNFFCADLILPIL